MALEDIGEDDTALLCVTNLTACCKTPYTTSAIGDWFFPNGTRVPAINSQWDMYRNRGEMVVRMYRKRDGEEGIYRCDIPNSMNITQSIYIGAYTAGTGEWNCFLTIIILHAYVAEEWCWVRYKVGAPMATFVHPYGILILFFCVAAAVWDQH